jgi:hypothetical protein
MVEIPLSEYHLAEYYFQTPEISKVEIATDILERKAL